MVKIIFEDDNFIAVNKPAGILTHGVNGIETAGDLSVARELVGLYPEIRGVGDDPNRPGIVHRLDKDTSGVLLLARNQEFFNYLKNLFQIHQIKKIYLVLVYGKVNGKRGIIDKPISIKSSTVRRTIHKGKMVKEAVTEYEVARVFKKGDDYFTLLKVIPRTGRTHQIRVHLASIGHPVVGDNIYGKKKNKFDIKRQFLHAESLEFSLADGKRIKIEADLPEDLKDVILDLGKYGTGNTQKN